MTNPFDQLSPLEISLVAVFGASLLIQLIYYLFVFVRVPMRRGRVARQDSPTPPPISVVICARNEEENLQQFLPLVLEQEYPNFEVVVVNDCSTDDTEMVLRNLEGKHKHLKVTYIKPDEKFRHGKKLALTVGIKAAQNPWLVLTDADCMPTSPQWLSSLAAHFAPPTDVVLGYGGYMPNRGLLNKWVRLDTFFIALQYLGWALAGRPYMGVGRNLAYRRDTFFAHKGFASHHHLPSGDDDLFVHQVARKGNTQVEFASGSRTLSVPPSTWGEWFRQKMRHLTTSPHYRFLVRLQLGVEPISRVLLWGTGLALLIIPPLLPFVGSALALRLLITGIIIKLAMNRLGERKLFLLSLFYDLLSPAFYLVLHLGSRLTIKNKRWI